MTEPWKYENECREEGFTAVCGIDEAGRGPLAGPVCAAAVILPYGLIIEGLDDSKKLTERKREALFDIIVSSAVSYAVAFADEKEIDRLNILGATFLAMTRAYEKLSVKPDIALVDGNQTGGLNFNCRAVIGGDGKSENIAAASILAKVTRDRFMIQAAAKYPDYAFEKHKGYGTKLHYEKIREFGPCDIHRVTFLRKMH